MGVFSKWRVFAKPEVLLKERVRENRYYPFRRLSDADGRSIGQDISSVYTCAYRLKRFYAALLMCAASLLFIIIWPAAGGEGEYVGFGVVSLVLSGYVAVEHYSLRRIVLDLETKHYSVYKGSVLLATEHCHNIYIRLVMKSSGLQHYLILDGVGLEEPIHLTKSTSDKKELRHLAHTITSNLELNYFDVHDKSKHHIIRQPRPPIAVSQPNIHEE